MSNILYIFQNLELNSKFQDILKIFSPICNEGDDDRHIDEEEEDRQGWAVIIKGKGPKDHKKFFKTYFPDVDFPMRRYGLNL